MNDMSNMDAALASNADGTLENAGIVSEGDDAKGRGIAPKDAQAKASGVYTHRFKMPFEYEGKEYESIDFHFERLTGRDVVAIESEMQANGEYMLDPILSRNFQSKMASMASGVGSDVLTSMPIKEFNQITNAARDFLTSSGY